MSCSSLKIVLPSNEAVMIENIRAYMKVINSEVAKAYSYLDQGFDPNAATNPDRTRIDPKWAGPHRLIMAAYQFYVFNLLEAVPGEIPFVQLVGRSKKAEYDKRYDLAVKTIRESINSPSSSLAGWWQFTLTGRVNGDPTTGNNPTEGFIGQNFRREWRDEDALRNQYHAWRLANVPTLSAITNPRDRADTYIEEAVAPTSTEGKWQTNTDITEK